MEDEESREFNYSSTIIGIWSSGIGHKRIYCNSSITAVGENPVPVSYAIVKYKI